MTLTRRILYFGFLAAEELLEKALSHETSPQVSAVKFQMSLLSGLVKRGAKVTAITALPIAPYPRSTILRAPSTGFELFGGSVQGRLIGGLNLPVIKLLSRAFKLLSMTAGRGERKADVVVVYSLHTPFLLSAVLLKWLRNAKIVVFVPDLPMYMHGEATTGLHGLLKRIDNRLLRILVKQFDLAVPFAKSIADEWLPPNIKYMVVEGVMPEVETCEPDYTKEKRDGLVRLMYTGSFTQVARFATLFSQLEDLPVELIFVGDGADLSELRALSAQDPRIKVVPFVGESELAKLIQEADFLLNPRYSGWPGARYSFPSKLFDYALRGKPILSTKLPGIDKDFFDFFLPLDDTSRETLRSSLVDAISLDGATATKRARDTLAFCMSRNSPEAIAERVLAEIDKL